MKIDDKVSWGLSDCFAGNWGVTGIVKAIHEDWVVVFVSDYAAKQSHMNPFVVKKIEDLTVVNGNEQTTS